MLLTLIALSLAATSLAATTRPPDRDQLIFHAETINGEIIRSYAPDRPFNPASVVKVGTTLWALQILGPHHRYSTRVGIHGEWKSGVDTVHGPLVIDGGGDPDLHAENIFLIAAALNRLGIRRVTGGLEVTGNLWVGWEHGEAQRVVDPGARAVMMGSRVRTAIDHSRWTSSTKASWAALCARRGWPESNPPSVRISGSITYRPEVVFTTLVRHRSNPLPTILRRFNIYSNNDIVRIADGLGGVARLESFLRAQLADPGGQIDLQTASGEFRNRMTPRLVVGLYRNLHTTTALMGLNPRDLLPVLGCDPGPSRRMFPLLSGGQWARAVTCKSGTLTTTDGGVAVLSGTFASSDRGQVLFAVGALEAGNDLRRWRQVEQEWALDLIDTVGGATAAACGQDLPFSDTDAKIEYVVQRRAPAESPASGTSRP